MNLNLNFGLNMGLEQKLSPQMIQSLQLLQMNAMELEMAVKQELETNPLLEAADEVRDLDDDETPAQEEPADSESAEIRENADGGSVAEDAPDFKAAELPEETAPADEIDWETYLDDGSDTGEPRAERDASEEYFERAPVYERSLQDALLEQLHDREVAPRVAELVEYLVYSLDERGWLSLEADTAGRPGVDDGDPRHGEIQAYLEGRLEAVSASAEVREALHVLQSLDPPGVGARNLRECLLLQLRRRDDVSGLARRIVEEDFELLERLRISALAKRHETTAEAIQEAIREIGTLEPHPGRLYGTPAAVAVTPDLIVEEIEGELVLLLNDRNMPSLRISRAYAGLMRKGSKATDEEKKFVRAKLNAATWLIRAIEQRKSTMLKVMHAIIESQPDFFRKGPAHLRPLILQQIADKIGMHISTISRVTNGKYVQTPHGVFELKYFFSAAVTQSDGSEVSSVAARDEIRKLIAEEDPKNPLSDQKIVELLKERGLDVARRTVAKYRDQLEILPARLRKKY